MTDINDVEKFFPGLLKATIEWFKIYKIPDGKPENQFAFNGDAKNAAFATNVVLETHKFWKSLISKEVEVTNISCATTTVEDSPFLISKETAAQTVQNYTGTGAESEIIGDQVDKWHFIQLK